MIAPNAVSIPHGNGKGNNFMSFKCRKNHRIKINKIFNLFIFHNLPPPHSQSAYK